MLTEARHERSDLGELRIANEVVDHRWVGRHGSGSVAGMSGSVGAGFAEMIGRKNLSKGVKVEVGEEQAAVDLYVVMHYGVPIQEVAWKIQENVKRAVEGMTGLEVVEINVHVQGIQFPQEEKKVEEPRVK